MHICYRSANLFIHHFLEIMLIIFIATYSVKQGSGLEQVVSPFAKGIFQQSMVVREDLFFLNGYSNSQWLCGEKYFLGMLSASLKLPSKLYHHLGGFIMQNNFDLFSFIVMGVLIQLFFCHKNLLNACRFSVEVIVKMKTFLPTPCHGKTEGFASIRILFNYHLLKQ